jgi:hypothetical protein
MFNAIFTPSTELLEFTVSLDRKAIWQLDLHLTMQSVPITTKVLSLISAFGYLQTFFTCINMSVFKSENKSDILTSPPSFALLTNERVIHSV